MVKAARRGHTGNQALLTVVGQSRKKRLPVSVNTAYRLHSLRTLGIRCIESLFDSGKWSISEAFEVVSRETGFN